MQYVIIALLVIAAAALVIYLYYLLIRWLIVSVGPNFFYIVNILAGTAGPIVYGRALFRVFGNNGWRNAALVPLVTLLALVYFDFAYLNVVVSGNFLDSALAQTLDQWLAAVVFGSLLNRQVLEGLVVTLEGLPPWGFVLGSVAIKSALIPPLALVARGLECKKLGNAQPAFLWYFPAEATARNAVQPGTLLRRERARSPSRPAPVVPSGRGAPAAHLAALPAAGIGAAETRQARRPVPGSRRRGHRRADLPGLADRGLVAAVSGPPCGSGNRLGLDRCFFLIAVETCIP